MFISKPVCSDALFYYCYEDGLDSPLPLGQKLKSNHMLSKLIKKPMSKLSV